MLTLIEANRNKLSRWPRNPRHALIAALVLWIVPMLVISVLVAIDPNKRTVTPIYHAASERWWQHENLYIGPGGMNYLPHFAVLFSPFHLLPRVAADILWRVVAATLLAGGLWRVIRNQFSSAPEHPFLWGTILAMPLCMNALRNGQANATFGGLTLLAIAAVLEKRWWAAGVLIALTVAVKPLGIVLLLLAPIVYAPLRWRLLAGVLALVIFPFCFANPRYVTAQHHEALVNLQSCATVTTHRFADINGILRTFGTPLPPRASKIIRVAAGGLTLGLWWLGAKRLEEPMRGLWLYALAAGYLMLFNPMNEENSFVILAPAMGLWGVWFLFGPPKEAAPASGWGIAFMALTMALLPNLLWPLFRNKFALLWHPTMTIVFLTMLIRHVWGPAGTVAESRIGTTATAT